MSDYLSGHDVTGGGAALPPQPVVTSAAPVTVPNPDIGAAPGPGPNPVVAAAPNAAELPNAVDALLPPSDYEPQELVTGAGAAAELFAADSALAAACFCAASMAS